ncbi:pyridoxamine phosphate oxidase [Favolaschia claudopus]|uniref:Pyridoxamine phosphate oxidase n=1 Tax=Favolaschia claudopus TaxID=2862362 RepID=A0AAW0DJ95_9AGAR
MVQYYDEISPSLGKWIERQHVFWVATAPLSGDGHVNVSPKGGEGMFHIVNPRQVWYEDLTGSGVETVSHLRENGRITVMFNAFEGPPRILRLYGRGTVYEFSTPEFNALVPPESRKPGTRAIILVDVHKVGTSCGYAVPFFDFKSHRNRLFTWAAKKEALDVNSDAHTGFSALVDGLKRYWATKNLKSIDGLTGLTCAPYAEDDFAVNKEAIAYKPDNEKVKNQRAYFTGAVVQGGLNIMIGFSLGVAAASFYLRKSH